ncbi:alanine and proline rich membrane-anchored mycosin domain protein [Mycobacterium kansasii]|uniref:Alanine and proline rich membrane-anchored mycosin domain protein n=1 Tax=Mycobacterium kansasii TaxID=1768 RepID=A0A1V3WWI1_MYCKA|nr:alanine and proline rich membrane-anchored mycosin domain protein [Mycobacterium kansasii]
MPAFTLSSELGSAGGGLTGSKAREDWRIEMMVAWGQPPPPRPGRPAVAAAPPVRPRSADPAAHWTAPSRPLRQAVGAVAAERFG